jgi:hypothetical protein
LTVPVREHRAFLGDPVDVRCRVAEGRAASRIGTKIVPACVVGHEHDDVRLFLRHGRTDGRILVCDTNNGGRYTISTAEPEQADLSASDTYCIGNTDEAVAARAQRAAEVVSAGALVCRIFSVLAEQSARSLLV